MQADRRDRLSSSADRRGQGSQTLILIAAAIILAIRSYRALVKTTVPLIVGALVLVVVALMFVRTGFGSRARAHRYAAGAPPP